MQYKILSWWLIHCTLKEKQQLQMTELMTFSLHQVAKRVLYGAVPQGNHPTLLQQSYLKHRMHECVLLQWEVHWRVCHYHNQRSTCLTPCHDSPVIRLGHGCK